MNMGSPLITKISLGDRILMLRDAMQVGLKRYTRTPCFPLNIATNLKLLYKAVYLYLYIYIQKYRRLHEFNICFLSQELDFF